MKNNNIYELPKTETISYFDEAKWNKDLSVEELTKNEQLAELIYQDRLLHGAQYGPGFEEWVGWTLKKAASTALVVSYFTPIAPFTITATVGVATAGAISMAAGNSDEQKAGEHMMDIAVDAGLGAIGAIGAHLIPGAGEGSSKIVKTAATCCKHCPK